MRVLQAAATVHAEQHGHLFHDVPLCCPSLACLHTSMCAAEGSIFCICLLSTLFTLWFPLFLGAFLVFVCICPVIVLLIVRCLFSQLHTCSAFDQSVCEKEGSRYSAWTYAQLSTMVCCARLISGSAEAGNAMDISSAAAAPCHKRSMRENETGA